MFFYGHLSIRYHLRVRYGASYRSSYPRYCCVIFLSVVWHWGMHWCYRLLYAAFFTWLFIWIYIDWGSVYLPSPYGSSWLWMLELWFDMYKYLYMPYFIVLFNFLFLLLMYGLHHCPLGAELPFPWSLAKHWSFWPVPDIVSFWHVWTCLSDPMCLWATWLV